MKNSVAVQLLKRVFAVYLIIAITVTAIHMSQEYLHMKDLVTEELEDLEETFSPGLTASIWYLDYDIVDSILAGVVKIPAVVGVKIIDQDGKELSAIGSIIDQQHRLVDIDKNGTRVIQDPSPTFSNIFGHKFKLTQKNSYLGEVYFYSSENIVFQRVKVSFFFLIGNSIIKTFALWIIFLWLGRKYLSNPLSALTENLKTLNLDDLNNKVIDIKLKGKNELKLLEDAFNFMLRKLELSKDRLLSLQSIYQHALTKSGQQSVDLEFIFKHLYRNLNVSKAVLFAKDEGGQFFEISHYNSPNSFLNKVFSETDVEKIFRKHTTSFVIVNNISNDAPIFQVLNKKGALEVGCHLTCVKLLDDMFCVLYNTPDKNSFDSSDSVYLQNLLRELDIIRNNQKITQEKERAEEEKKELEKQLHHSQKLEAIGTLAGGIAHDFNNILMPIIGYTEIIMDDPELDNEVRSNLETIFQSGIRAKEIVQHILTFSRQEKQALRPLRLQPIINETLRLFRSSVPARIEIIKKVDVECGPVLANPTQIHQILMNLFNNALHAMKGSSGTLTIQLSEVLVSAPIPSKISVLSPGKYVVINVKDTGIGIEESVIEKIFDPYFTTKKVGEGTGLGLSVIHGIVKGYNGTISVESVPNKGTSFSTYLPQISGEVLQTEMSLLQGTPKGEETILIVDDEESVALTLQLLLESLGYQTVIKCQALDALQYMEENSDEVDLVITDLTMPKLSGLELSKKVKTIKENIPVIICSGYGNQVSQEEYKNAAVNAYIMKPVLKQDLANKVRDLLDLSKVENFNKMEN